jgi:hypothetical protein
MVYIHFESDSKISTQRHRKWLASSHHKLQGAIEVQTVQGAMKGCETLGDFGGGDRLHTLQGVVGGVKYGE